MFRVVRAVRMEVHMKLVKNQVRLLLMFHEAPLNQVHNHRTPIVR